MSVGLIALLDEVAAMAKVAATSLDGVAATAAKAGVKAAGVVVDDAAVTPRYVLGFAAERELPIVWRIAAGSFRNKLLILLPATLALSYLLPSMITPLLMFGSIYLCYEGTQKAFEALIQHRTRSHEIDLSSPAPSAHLLEEEKVASAIRTDLILSAEIMAITLAAVSEKTILAQAVVLAIVGAGITIAVYGLVALVVKADDIGMSLATNRRASIAGSAGRAVGRALVLSMPGFLSLLGAIGTAAMIWVGGSIFVHGLQTYHVHFVGKALHATARSAAEVLPPVIGPPEEIAFVILALMAGLLTGIASILLIEFAAKPCRKFLKRTLRLHLGCLLPSDPST